MSHPLSFQNPILPGFYPDPSVVRVDDVFYMINSSFQFFPGLPIHKSYDLVHWEHIGNAICRITQLNLNQATTKINRAEYGEFFTAGLYAPTIRYFAGTFYIVCTNLKGRDDMPSEEDFSTENFIITTNDLSSPKSFSDPTYFDFHGIDPSLYFDDDGKVYMQGSWIYGYRKSPATVIRQAQIDLTTGKYLSELRDIWTGSGDKVPEGPHIYKKDEVYWLLIAEGGTHCGHKITMARSDNIWGPYESYKGNPVLTSESRDHVIQCVGHGDLFNDTEGGWWCTMLGRQEHDDAYPLGRETYLVPITWPKDRFPSLPSVKMRQFVSIEGRKLPSRLLSGNPKAPPHTVRLDSPHTLWLRTPDSRHFTHGSKETQICVKSTLIDLGSTEGSPSFVGQRQVALDTKASVTLDLQTLPVRGHYGLSLYKDTYRHVSLDVDGDRDISLATAHRTQNFAFDNAQSIAGFSAVKLTIRATVKAYVFSYDLLKSTHQGSWRGEVVLGTVSSADMSGDDFTGTVFGVYASGSEDIATFDDFKIEGQNLLATRGD